MTTTPTWRPMPSTPMRVELVRGVYEDLAAGGTIMGTARERGVHTTQVRTWTRNPARWSPFVDEVAVRRALDFEACVIERLSVVEFDALCAALNDAQWEPTPLNQITGWDDDGVPIVTSAADLDARGQRWNALPREWKESVRSRRALLRERAAAA